MCSTFFGNAPNLTQAFESTLISYGDLILQKFIFVQKSHLKFNS